MPGAMPDLHESIATSLPPKVAVRRPDIIEIIAEIVP
jgi:hypothetical protein